MNRIHRVRNSCRACGGRHLQTFLSLGTTPLANSFVSSPDGNPQEPYFPLELYFCHHCSLVQLRDVISPETLFRDYIYLTGTSETIAAHNAEYAETVISLLELGSQDSVVEIASNDGSLLQEFHKHGVQVLGVEPARNIAEIARSKGIETVSEFFDVSLAKEIRVKRGPVKAVIANNVLAHIDDTQGFLGGCRELLSAAGQVIIEVPYIRDMVDRLEYDTVYHEHLCYFSVKTLACLCEAVGLSIVRLDHVPVHGGSVRLFAESSDEADGHAPEILRLIEEEALLGLSDFGRYERFALDVEGNRKAFRELMQELHSDGKSVGGYGAPAKGNTLLNFCGIDNRLLPFTVDRNPLKVGLYTPGMHIPVLPVDAILERQPDYLLILAWNFADEIMSQQREYRNRGGHFIVPIPEPRVM